jgi:hypothetical protein
MGMVAGGKLGAIGSGIFTKNGANSGALLLGSTEVFVADIGAGLGVVVVLPPPPWKILS